MWQVLINKGVLVDEIKLYGEAESNEVLDDSLTEDSFADLEAVISKVVNNSDYDLCSVVQMFLRFLLKYSLHPKLRLHYSFVEMSQIKSPLSFSKHYPRTKSHNTKQLFF